MSTAVWFVGDGCGPCDAKPTPEMGESCEPRARAAERETDRRGRETMTVERRRAAVFTADGRCRVALPADLVAAALRSGAAPAAAEFRTFSATEARPAPPGVLAGVAADLSFDNAGTDPRITDAEFSATEYRDTREIGSDGRVWLRAMTDAGLNALASPPPSPFTVAVDSVRRHGDRAAPRKRRPIVG